MSYPKVSVFKTDNQLRLFHMAVALIMIFTVLTSPSLGIKLLENRVVHKILYVLIGLLGVGSLIYHYSVYLKNN